jgi:hypothetical protein
MVIGAGVGEGVRVGTVLEASCVGVAQLVDNSPTPNNRMLAVNTIVSIARDIFA